jgi:hypothetical protein
MIRKPLDEMKKIALAENSQKHILFQPQHTFICNESGEIKMDFVGRYEQLDTDFKSICLQIDIPHQPLKKRNSSQHRKPELQLDSELKEMVYDFYQNDFELFDYSL